MIKINDYEIVKRGSTFDVYWRDSKTDVRPFIRFFNSLSDAICHVTCSDYFSAIGFAPVNPKKLRKLPVQLKFSFDYV